jgi:hypothetical protein
MVVKVRRCLGGVVRLDAYVVAGPSYLKFVAGTPQAAKDLCHLLGSHPSQVLDMGAGNERYGPAPARADTGLE